MSKQKKEFRPQTHGTIYVLAMFYLGYLLFQIIRGALAGGSDAPTTAQLVTGIVLLGGGMVVLGVLAWRMSRMGKQAEQEKGPEEDGDQKEQV
jgi:hypothetical protein